MIQPLHQCLITPFGFIKLICLLLEYIQYIVGGVALVKLGGEWMRLEGFSRLFLVLLQSGIEYGLESREGRNCVTGCGHTGLLGEQGWVVAAEAERGERQRTRALPPSVDDVAADVMALALLLISAPMK
jgi:hypothetical protein